MRGPLFFRDHPAIQPLYRVEDFPARFTTPWNEDDAQSVRYRDHPAFHRAQPQVALQHPNFSIHVSPREVATQRFMVPYLAVGDRRHLCRGLIAL